MEQLKAMGNKAPSRSSYFGLIDLAGFPKDIYYLYQSQWNPEKQMAHILPHWNWAGREGQKTPVMVFTSGDEAELFVNGKSQGVRRRGEGPTFTQKDKSLVVSKNQFRFAWEDVVYEPGTVEVVVKKNGQPWATAKRVTTGDSAAVSAKVDRSTIVGDARDIAHVELALTDANGNVVPTDSRKVSFSIEGPAVLAGFCNGNPIDHTSLQDPNQKFFNGRILAVVRGKRGESGTATVTVKAEGLPEIKVPVEITAPQK
jgi:beta-galactosidase